jgi:hypothetical protein
MLREKRRYCWRTDVLEEESARVKIVRRINHHVRSVTRTAIPHKCFHHGANTPIDRVIVRAKFAGAGIDAIEVGHQITEARHIATNTNAKSRDEIAETERPGKRQLFLIG